VVESSDSATAALAWAQSRAPGLRAADPTLDRHAEKVLAAEGVDVASARGVTSTGDDGIARLRLSVDGGDTRPRLKSAWWRNRPDELAGLMLWAPPYVTADEARETLTPVVASWRVAPSAPKPWWRLW
jgi:hypothetical protein